MYKATSLVAAVVLVAVIAAAVTAAPKHDGASPPGDGPESLGAGTVPPAFSLPRLGGGPPVSLSAYRGAPVIVNFFASWCPHCLPELPALAALGGGGPGGVEVVGVDSNDRDMATARRDLQRAGATYPVAIDAKAQISTQYLLTALPATYFIGADGRVVGAAFGPQTSASLSTWVERMTKGSADASTAPSAAG